MKPLVIFSALCLCTSPVWALSLSDLTNSEAGQQLLSQVAGGDSNSEALADVSQTDATTALKDALIQGAQTAVSNLSQTGGFSENDNVRIELPFQLGTANKALGLLSGSGIQGDFSALESGMNKAAEAAVPEAQELLVEAISNMTLSDAKDVLEGDDDAATSYLEKSSRDQLYERFLPIVKESTDQIDLAQQYNALVASASAFGVAKAEKATVENYVTDQALDGLFYMLAEKEAEIRANPAEAATSMAQQIFGLLGGQ